MCLGWEPLDLLEVIDLLWFSKSLNSLEFSEAAAIIGDGTKCSKGPQKSCCSEELPGFVLLPSGVAAIEEKPAAGEMLKTSKIILNPPCEMRE